MKFQLFKKYRVIEMGSGTFWLGEETELRKGLFPLQSIIIESKYYAVATPYHLLEVEYLHMSSMHA